MGALDMRDPGMSELAYEVSDLVTGMARILEFDEERIRHAATVAFLHDSGKIALLGEFACFSSASLQKADREKQMRGLLLCSVPEGLSECVCIRHEGVK
jgi:response regulator RpfG family c-di-GMP phosphodiesterase